MLAFFITLESLHGYIVEIVLLLLFLLGAARIVTRELKSLRKEWKQPDD
jgi:hypothetical protein